MTVYILEENYHEDCEMHDTYNHYFASLDDALQYAEKYKNTQPFSSFSILELYPEYDYTETVYEYEPENKEYPYDYSDDEESREYLPEDPWEAFEYEHYLEAMQEEMEEEPIIDEWLESNTSNLPWKYSEMTTFIAEYKKWCTSPFDGKPKYSTPLRAFKAFLWHIDNDRKSIRHIKPLFNLLRCLYGADFVCRFIV